MAKNEKNGGQAAKNGNGHSTEIERVIPQAASLDFVPAGWVGVVDRSLIYKPEECGKTPVQGIMLGTQEMNPSKINDSENNKNWTALVVRLTMPTKAVDSQGNVVDVPAGEQVFVGGADMASLYKVANSALDAYECLLIPDKILALGGGRKMWLYKKAVNARQPYNREKHGLAFFARSPKKQDEVETSPSPTPDIPF